jgi:hypothetical protein
MQLYRYYLHLIVNRRIRLLNLTIYINLQLIEKVPWRPNMHND